MPKPKKKATGKFARWLESTKKTDRDFSAIIDVTPQYIAMLRRGDARPGLKVAVKISIVSKGKVPITSWV